jgi:Flp pilus assembly pilin Flp
LEDGAILNKLTPHLGTLWARLKFRVVSQRDEKGAAITEYAAALAFVALLIALAFNIGQGSMKASLSSSYGQIPNQLTHAVVYGSGEFAS